MKLSKTKLTKKIEQVKQIRLADDENRYFIGYEDALRWVKKNTEPNED